jgi:hypothetical protein
VTWLPASPFAAFLAVAGALTLPIISLGYLMLRLEARKRSLVNFFGQEAVVDHYLRMRGCLPARPAGEDDAAYARRLRAAFDTVFADQLGQLYSVRNFVIPMALAFLAAALGLLVVVRESFGPPLAIAVPSAVRFAIFGAFVWSVWMVIRAYTRNDLTPATFYWVFFRHLLAVGYGALAGQIFTPAYADLGTFFAAALPFSQLVRFFGSRLGTVGGLAPAEGAPKLTDIQGMDGSVVQRLEELEVHTAQDLAFSDPLELLLLSNFPPKVLIDWMDQALLLNYVGDGLPQLRLRGIRGAIEMASLHDKEDKDDRLSSLAGALKVSHADVRNLIDVLYDDNQLRFIWGLWGVFEEPRQED